MLILLPPSEGKTAPERGTPVNLSSLSFPSLGAPRTKVLRALIDLCANNPQHAAATLDLGPRQLDWVTRNAHLRKAPCAPASEIYSGVLFEALGLRSLTTAQRKRAASRLAMSSALFGFVGIDDDIPAYRLSGDTRLPHLSLKEVWVTPLTEVLTSTPGLVVDMRSGAYAALAPLPNSLRERSASVKVIRPDGSTVSHHNKSTKGHLARMLATMGRTPRSIEALCSAVRAEGFSVHLEEKAGAPELVVVAD